MGQRLTRRPTSMLLHVRGEYNAPSPGGVPPVPSYLYQMRWVANGPYTIDTDVDGAFLCDFNFNITSVRLWRGTAGTSGSTILDVHKNSVTMYTTQGNRPTIVWNAADKTVDCTLPDIVAIGAGDIITMDIDAVEGGVPQDVVLVVEGTT